MKWSLPFWTIFTVGLKIEVKVLTEKWPLKSGLLHYLHMFLWNYTTLGKRHQHQEALRIKSTEPIATFNTVCTGLWINHTLKATDDQQDRKNLSFTVHWRIGPIFFSFIFMQFSAKIWPHDRLAPPSGKYRICHCSLLAYCNFLPPNGKWP